MPGSSLLASLAVLSVLSVLTAGCLVPSGPGETPDPLLQRASRPIEAAAVHPTTATLDATVKATVYGDEEAYAAAWPTWAMHDSFDFGREVFIGLAWGPLPSSGYFLVIHGTQWSAADGFLVTATLQVPALDCATQAGATTAYGWTSVDRVADLSIDQPVRLALTTEVGPCPT